MKNRLSDDNYNKLGELIEWLHDLADQLTRLLPKYAVHLFAEQVPHLELELERAKGAIDKQRYDLLREQKKKNRKGKHFPKLVKTYANSSL